MRGCRERLQFLYLEFQCRRYSFCRGASTCSEMKKMDVIAGLFSLSVIVAIILHAAVLSGQ